MKVSPVGASPLGPSIALSPALNTLNLERHRENVLYDIYRDSFCNILFS